jgi:ABC-type phosphate transport system substrate-binding protein
MKPFSPVALLILVALPLALCPQVIARTTTNSSSSVHSEPSGIRIAIFAGSATGNPPDSSAQRVDPNTPTSPYAGVGSVGGCSGVVIAPTYVLTARHCTSPWGSSLPSFFINTSSNPIVIPVQTYTNSPSTDLAILKLASPVPTGVPIYSLYQTPLQIGTIITMVGYGQSGYGDVGISSEPTSTVKRVGQNIVDVISSGQDTFSFDFDGPDASTNVSGGLTLGNNVESTLGGGDSGGPSFITIGNTLSIVGIHSASTANNYGAPAFGTTGIDSSIYYNLPWINSVVPEALSAPYISGFTPASGAVGATVILTGFKFTGTTAVQFNGTASTNYTVNSDTQITAVVPIGAASGPISVLSPSGTASTTYFTVIPTAQGQAPAVSQDPTITLSASNTSGTISQSAVQYFANGSTFSAIVLRRLLDFYGVAIPATELNATRQFGSTGLQPVNSPRLNYVQYNYCGTGDANGTATFTGIAAASSFCSFVAATSSTATILGAPNQAPTPLPNTLAGPYVFTPFPSFPIGSSSSTVATTAPLFTFSDASASTSALSATDLTNYENNKKPTRGNPVQVPVFFGAIVPAVNASVNNGVPPNLTTVELCKVFDRQITNFSQIASTASLNLPIQVVVRSDSSGTTSAFTAYLASACRSAGVVTPGFPGYYLTAAVSSFPKFAGTSSPTYSFTPRVGGDLVSKYVATTSGGFGYVESAFVQPYSTIAPSTSSTHAPIQAALQNPISGSFIIANADTVQASLGNINLSANVTYPCVLTTTGLPAVPTVSNAYPIITQSYALTYTNYTQAEANALRGAFTYILSNRTSPIQSNDQIAQATGLVLPSNPLRIVERGCINNSANIPTGFSPSNGSIGTAVTIIGNGFSASTLVTFLNSSGARIPASSVTLNSASSITATVPTGAVTGSIRVGSTNTTRDFTVLP